MVRAAASVNRWSFLEGRMNLQSRIVFTRVVICVVLTSLTLVACGKSGSSDQTQTQSTSNPVPLLASVSPTTAVAGASAVKITASGSSFIPSSTINWNGTPLTTTYLNSEAISAEINPSDLQAGANATITVTNPSPGGGTSSGIRFSVTNPAPTLTAISPASANAGSAAITLTATGTNFTTSSAVIWAGTVIPTTYTNSTSLTAQVSAADLQTGGAMTVTVENPSP